MSINYYNRNAGYDILEKIVANRHALSKTDLLNLYSNYIFVFETSMGLEKLGDSYQIYHSIPLNNDLSVDTLIISRQGAFLIHYVYYPFKNVEILGDIISLEEKMDKETILKIKEKADIVSETFHIERKNVYTILAVKSANLSFGVDSDIDYVTKYDNLLGTISRNNTTLIEEDNLIYIKVIIENYGVELGFADKYISGSELLAEAMEVIQNLNIDKIINKKKKFWTTNKFVSLFFITWLIFLFSNKIDVNKNNHKTTKNQLSSTNVDPTYILNQSNSNSQPVFEKIRDLKLCPDLNNCRVGETTEEGGTIFYDAGTNEDWGRYLIMPNYLYALRINNNDENYCNLLDGESKSDFINLYNGGSGTMDVVNNNMFITDRCKTFINLYQKTVKEDLTSYMFLIPTLEEAELLNYYLSKLQNPNSFNPKYIALVTSTISDKGLYVLDNGYKTTDTKKEKTLILVRIENE